MAEQNRVQQIYNEIREGEKKKKELTQVIKDAYVGIKEYEDINEEMNKLRTRRKEIEATIKSQYATEYNQLEDLKTDIKDTKIVLSDLMWNEIMKNNPIEIVDEYNNKYVPNVMVSLKKED